MATYKSTQITNRDASPVALTAPSSGAPGLVRNAAGKVAVATTHTTSDFYKFCEIPSNARVISMKVWSGALGGTAAMNIGIYRTTRDGGAVVDGDKFASALSLVTALAGTEQSNESTEVTIAMREQPLWQVLGLTADPAITYDIGGALTAVAASNGDVLVSVDYVI